MATGCTEPGAVAYASSLAREHAGGTVIEKIEVSASVNVIKNVTAVNIPGTDGYGMDLAAAMGAVVGSSENKLEILAFAGPEDLANANKLLEKRMVKVKVEATPYPVYIAVTVKTDRGQAQTIIAGHHTHVALLEANGQILIDDFPTEGSDPVTKLELKLTPDIIWDFVQNIELSELGIIQRLIQVNTRLGQEGLSRAYGLEVGRTIMMGMQNGFYTDDLCSYAMAFTAAASDARMAGCLLPAFSNSGSGNQGLQSSLPVIAVAQKLKMDEDSIVRAVALSSLITIYIKVTFGRLSALCGATVAAIGSSCGIVYLMGGSLEQVKSAIQNMIGNVPGILCDGAKAGCSMKIATCTSAAIQSALLALRNIKIQSTDGIINEEVEKTVSNLGELSNISSDCVDKKILQIMLDKNQAQ
jgi:L-cysteine desulfidase